MTKPIDFLQRLALLKPVIWQEVKRCLPGRPSHPHYRMVQDYPKRQGRYFRPALFLMALELFGANWQNHLGLAAALQLCEDWLLVHDDVEDESNERRGRSSLNALYGNALAVNAGDVLHAAMWKAVYGYLGREHVKNEQLIFSQFFNMLKLTLEGQFEELWWARNQKIDLPYAAYHKMALKKTCYYTVIGPVRLAGIIAGIPEKKVGAIETWAIPFGRSFQIWDDVLDLEQDIREGKRTLILLHLLKHAGSKAKRQIIQTYKKPNGHKTNKDIQTVVRLMKSSRSIEYAQKQAKHFSQDALGEFKHFSAEFPDSPGKSQIQEAMSFVVTRNN